jgi:hypothetical protein
MVQYEVDAVPGDFAKYVQEKLGHLRKDDRQILEPVLRQYKHLFYTIGSRKLGCTSQVEHGIETGSQTHTEKSLPDSSRFEVS